MRVLVRSIILRKHNGPPVLSSWCYCAKFGKFRQAFPAITSPPLWMASASRSFRSVFW